ncbi:hypothetical protein BKA61DRAFT_660773 [Leptodontidium sp. MPI-SDFR-AT-0119]|nr:hypothetical protein BKA61DRAFT_660773 [Leptodontidium sp. MPI-SDFR-AT-0119]
MFGTLSIIGSSSFRNGGGNMLVLTILAASLVSGDTVVNMLLSDSSIGESDINFRGKVVGSIIGVDSIASTYDIAYATTGSIHIPFTTPACVGGDHVIITQGPSTMFLSQIFVTASTSRNFRESCSFSNTEIVTCSLINTVSEVFVVDGQTATTSYTETSSGVNAPPTNPPLYFAVTITAGLEKLTTAPTRSTSNSPTASQTSGSATESRTSSGAEEVIGNGKWSLLWAWLTIMYFAALS